MSQTSSRAQTWIDATTDLALTALVSVLLLVVPTGRLGAEPARPESIVIPATRDNTLIEDAKGSVSNGSGPFLFTGRVSASSDFLRRAVIAFDVAEYVPSGSVLLDASLVLYVAPSNATPETVAVHRLLANWGEGISRIGSIGSVFA